MRRLAADRAYPPSGAEAAALKRAGVEVVIGYLPGYTPDPWTTEQWRACKLEGGIDLFLPVFVPSSRTDGRGDAHRCADLMHQIGWDPHKGRACLLDIEANWGDPSRYEVDWASTFHDEGYLGYWYGTAANLSALGASAYRRKHNAHVSGVLCADYKRTGGTYNGEKGPNLDGAEWPVHGPWRRGHRGQQFWNEVTVPNAGGPYDLSVVEFVVNPVPHA